MKDCIEYLQLRNIFVWRNNSGALKGGRLRFGLKGSSDILGLLPNGRFLAVECKREKGGVVSEEQRKFLQTITENKGLAVCVNSVEQLKEIIEKNI